MQSQTKSPVVGPWMVQTGDWSSEATVPAVGEFMLSHAMIGFVIDYV